MDYGVDNSLSFEETEQILIKVHEDLVDFYEKYKPENVNEDVLNILMQFFVDSGGIALNKKLRSKYGVDLITFRRNSVINNTRTSVSSARASKAIRDVKRRTQRSTLEKELNIQVPPSPKFETNMSSKRVTPRGRTKGKKTKSKKKNNDPELAKYKTMMAKEAEKGQQEIEDAIFGTAPKDEAKLMLTLLDEPRHSSLSARDLVEAFYAKYDESKFDTEGGIQKIVDYVEKHGADELSKRLKVKYGEGLNDLKMIAGRRKNLEMYLTRFYSKHDKKKLQSRWTILKILSWAISNGIPALNKKFKARYGEDVVPTSPNRLSLIDY